MSAKPCRLRLSPALRALVDAASPNASAAQRALMLLGANIVGYDLSGCWPDLGRLLGEELDPRVRAAIDALYSYRGPGVGPPSHDWPTADLPAAYQAPTAVPQGGHPEPTAGLPPAEAPGVDLAIPGGPPLSPAKDDASPQPLPPDAGPFASGGIVV